MGLFSFLHARCDAEQRRSEVREQALREEIRGLTADIRRLSDSLVALADKRALQVVNHEAAPARTEEEKARRPTLRIPPYANSLATRGHVDLNRIRREMDHRHKAANGGKPAPVVE